MLTQVFPHQLELQPSCAFSGLGGRQRNQQIQNRGTGEEEEGKMLRKRNNKKSQQQQRNNRIFQFPFQIGILNVFPGSMSLWAT